MRFLRVDLGMFGVHDWAEKFVLVIAVRQFRASHSKVIEVALRMTEPEPILSIDSLSISFYTEDGIVRAVRDVSFTVPEGRTVALLGESGCGKSVTARAVLNLIDPPGRHEGGAIRWKGKRGDVTQGDSIDILRLKPEGERMRRIRWNEVAMIFQDPSNSLTPAYPVGDQVMEAIRLHLGLNREQARKQAIHLLREAGIPAPERTLHDYPHQLSGGMCQRVMIAMALSCRPRLLIADEPTTALDVTIQAQVLQLLKQAQRDHGTAILLIAHDMGVVAEMADEVVVMYLGHVVERGPVREIFNRPRHPYTQGLFASMPRPGWSRAAALPSIPGTVPDPFHVPGGCPFRGRCPNEAAVCVQPPVMQTVGEQHVAACVRLEESDT